jgi:hypothetical protein
VWNLIFNANGQRKIEYTHLRGNELQSHWRDVSGHASRSQGCSHGAKDNRVRFDDAQHLR